MKGGIYMSLSPTVVCNNVLQRAFNENIPITPMKLQKLLYFIGCEYAKLTNCDMLSEDFGVWQYGPVLPTVYDEFKSFGGNPITAYAKDASSNSYAVDETTAPNLRTAIERIWSNLKGYNGIVLSQITHRDKSGWSCAYCEGRPKITKDEMKADDTYGEYLLS